MCIKLFFIFLLFVCAPGWSCAQTTAEQQKPKRKTKVETNYEEKKNETQARIGPLELWNPPQNSVSGEMNYESVDLVVSFSYPGKRVVKPKFVILLVFSHSQWGAQFDRKRDLSVSTDTGQYNFGEMELLGKSEARVPGTALGPATLLLVREVVRKSMPFDDFTRIAQSNKAEIKLGDRKFKLKKEHLEAFRNFALLMEQEGLEF